MGMLQPSAVPSYFSYNEVKQIINQLNQLFQQNKDDLCIQLMLISSRLAYNHSNWKRSTVPGKIIILPKKNQDPDQSIILSVEGVYKLFNTMKHLKKDSKNKRSRNFRSSKELNEKIQKMKVQQKPMTKQQNSPTFTGTPGKSKIASYIDPQQGKQCCICFQKMSTCALPCSHLFCDICTIKYIIEKQQKKCPICRQVFQGTSQKVAKQVYTVIQQQQQVYQQIRKTILGILSEDNTRVVNKIKEEKSQELNIQDFK